VGNWLALVNLFITYVSSTPSFLNLSYRTALQVKAVVKVNEGGWEGL